MANASVQLAVDSRLRGRVMGLYMLAFIGGTLIGAPLIGALTSQFGARVGMTVCGCVPALAAVVMATASARRRRAEASAAHVRPADSGPALPADLQLAELTNRKLKTGLGVPLVRVPAHGE